MTIPGVVIEKWAAWRATPESPKPDVSFVPPRTWNTAEPAQPAIRGEGCLSRSAAGGWITDSVRVAMGRDRYYDQSYAAVS